MQVPEEITLQSGEDFLSRALCGSRCSRAYFCQSFLVHLRILDVTELFFPAYPLVFYYISLLNS